MSASRNKGTRWESVVVDFLREHGVPHAERRTLGGAKDRGDITGIPGIVVEAKNTREITLSTWIDEAEAERRNDNADLGVVWFHRRGKGSPGQGYVCMTGDALVKLLAKAGYIKPESEWGSET